MKEVMVLSRGCGFGFRRLLVFGYPFTNNILSVVFFFKP